MKHSIKQRKNRIADTPLRQPRGLVSSTIIVIMTVIGSFLFLSFTVWVVIAMFSPQPIAYSPPQPATTTTYVKSAQIKSQQEITDWMARMSSKAHYVVKLQESRALSDAEKKEWRQEIDVGEKYHRDMIESANQDKADAINKILGLLRQTAP